MSIEAVHLTHCYSEGSALKTVALNDVSFRIEEGEFVGIIGHTGSGKSTLVQHLNGLLKPSSGQVLVDGEDLNGEHVDRRALRQRIGLVLDYAKYAERSPFELSGGQMRRAAIAGVLAMRPSVLILDEPTAGLDPKGRDKILTMLEELHAAGHVTIIMVSHSMDDMARLATRLLVMSEGKIIAQGTPREIFAQAEMMTSIGLDVPDAARLCRTLREKGYDLPADLYRPEELKEHLLRIWKEVQSC